MRRLLPLFCASGLAGLACQQTRAPQPPPVREARAPLDAGAAADCTMDTPLVPGVPGSPGHLLPSDLNPNGASELAALMRTMQADLTAARPVLLDGGAIAPLLPRYRKMRCAWPTDPVDRNALFDGLAQAYLINVENLDRRTPDALTAFDNVLGACHTCHDNSCPGPLVVIDKLRIVPLDAGAADAGRR